MREYKRTQLRGICPICGGEYAIQNGLVVSHGYTRKWGANLSECIGSGKPHYGDIEARKFLAHRNLELLTLRNKSDKPQSYNAEIAHITQRLDDWKPMQPRMVDLDIEEAEQAKARQLEREAKRSEKANKEASKEAKRLEREAKTAQKWKAICANNVHQIELDGEIVVEWIQAYASRRELEHDHADRFSQFTKERYGDDTQERINAAWRAIHRVRENTAKRKQLIKY